ncbi:TPA: hypothetical protein ACH1J3_004840 [Citrobacter werkmanii]
MSSIDDIRASVERERYKLVSEMERFDKLKVTYEQLVEKAKTNPKIAAQLQEFEALYGPMLQENMENIVTQIRQAEEQYQSLKRMVDMRNNSLMKNAQPQIMNENGESRKKETVTSVLHKNFI